MTFEVISIERELRKLERKAQKSTIPATGRIHGVLVDVTFHGDIGFICGLAMRGWKMKIGEWKVYDSRQWFISEFFDYLETIEKRRKWNAKNKIIPDYGDKCK